MKKLLYLIDDGNRQEKVELIYYLKNKFKLSFVTHNQETFNKYKDEFQTFLIKPNNNRRIFRSILKLLFVKPLNTNNRFYRDSINYQKVSIFLKVILLIKKRYQKLIFINCSVAKIYQWVYPLKNKKYKFLNDYDLILYSPVSLKCSYVLHEARMRGLKVINWVYSWDNPMKDNETMKGADYYLVWNKECKADLKKYHQISDSKVFIVGPIQFDYLLERNRPNSNYKTNKYVLYVCAYGVSEHVEQEIINIIGIKKLLKNIDPTIEFVVRPYPFILDMSLYQKLIKEEINLDPLPDEWNPKKLTKKDILKKKDQLNNAVCVINFSSTIVLEASFTNTPILQMLFSFKNNFPDALHINQTLKNPHLKYLILNEYPNICKSEESMKVALTEILQGHNKKFMDYSDKLQKFAHPIPNITAYRHVFVDTLSNIIIKEKK